MDELMDRVSKAQDAELARARKIYGDEFNSPHEAYGVVLEELYEAEQEMKLLQVDKGKLMPALWQNDVGEQMEIYKQIEITAKQMAVELIQVASMCKKAYESPCINYVEKDFEVRY